MNKIKYHPHCRMHDQVKSVKRQITRLIKACDDINPNFYHNLTGVVYEDEAYLKYIIRESVRKFGDLMIKEYKANMEHLECDFFISRYKIHLKWIEGLNEIKQYIIENYPVDIKVETFTFKDPSANPSVKKSEYENHFKANPIIGFVKEWFAIKPDGEKRQLWSLTSTEHDLIDVTHIEIHYQ